MDDDKRLIDELKRGEADATRALFRRYSRSVYRFVHVRVAGRVEVAEEVTQDVFLDAFLNIDAFDTTRDFWSWLCGIARRKIARAMRKERRAQRHALDDPDLDPDANARRQITLCFEQDTALPEAALERQDVRRAIAKAMTALDPRAQEMLLMKYVENASLAEIAERSGKSSQAVSSALQRARQAFRKAFESDQKGHDA